MSRPAAGLLPVDKPEGPTSHDVVAAARRALGERRIGHTGTLDPFASGLLLLCVGWATRLADYLRPLPKSYLAVATLGADTDTDDRTGKTVRSSGAWRDLEPDAVRRAFESHTGERFQRPPAYSAKKVAGERQYHRARRGEAAAAAPASVVIHRLEVRELALPRVSFEVECSSGTYIRAIARDVGAELGVGAHLDALRRTSVGPHHVTSAVPADRLDDDETVASAWIRPLDALKHLPRLDVDAAARDAVGHGVAIDAAAPPAANVADPIALAHGGELIAIGEAVDGKVRPRKVFLGA